MYIDIDEELIDMVTDTSLQDSFIKEERIRKMKNKYTSQLKYLDNRLRLKLTNIEPDFTKLCSSIQSQPSP